MNLPKELARSFIHSRATQRASLPSQSDIRRQLGWELIPANQITTQHVAQTVSDYGIVVPSEPKIATFEEFQDTFLHFIVTGELI